MYMYNLKLISLQKPGLTRETFLAIKQTLSALIDLVPYLLEELHFNYILLRFFQSNNLESRFGWYRQMHGGNYLISMKQVIQSERKIRTISLLQQTEMLTSNTQHQDRAENEESSIPLLLLKKLLLN